MSFNHQNSTEEYNFSFYFFGYFYANFVFFTESRRVREMVLISVNEQMLSSWVKTIKVVVCEDTKEGVCVTKHHFKHCVIIFK